MMTVDVRVSKTARTPGSGCPADPCVAFLKDPKHWAHPFAIASGWISRLYFGTIGGLSGAKHTFVVEIEAAAISDQAALEALTKRAQPILDSVGIPEVILNN